MDDKVVISVWVAQIGVVISMFGILWRSIARHKEQVQTKENCMEIRKGLSGEIKGLGQLMAKQFEMQKELEVQKMEFYKEQINGLVASNKKVEEKVEKLLAREK